MIVKHQKAYKRKKIWRLARGVEDVQWGGIELDWIHSTPMVQGSLLLRGVIQGMGTLWDKQNQVVGMGE